METGQLDYYQTQIALLQGRTLAAKVISDLQLESNPAFTSARVVPPNPLTRLQNWFFGLLDPIIYYVASFFETPPPDKAKINNTQASRSAQSSSVKQNIAVPPESKYTGQYRSFLKVQALKNTRLVDVQFSTPDPNLSQQLANEHAARFIRLNFESRVELTKEARDFLDEKNAELKEKLQGWEDEVKRHWKKAKISFLTVSSI
ncbi:MAG: hypothetical protein E6J74_41235 [Deltaproteobacteria bacterium]|nr:MAG: hypothetical protein E6J74_41235 [Deltaproteobacteria bacterium]